MSQPMTFRIGVLPVVFTCLTAHAATVYVTPKDSVQAAINRASNGDTIVLRDGSYYETIAITKSIVLKAEHGGKATLTNAHRGKVQFRPEKSVPGMYSAKVPWPVRWVMLGDRNLYDYIDLNGLQTFTAQPKYTRLAKPWKGFPEGFVWENGTLYVRLEGDQDPNTSAIEINSGKLNGRSQFVTNNGVSALEPYFRPRSEPLVLDYNDGRPPRPGAMPKSEPWHFPSELGVLVSVQADGVVIEGLRLHLAPHVAIDVQNSKRVTIRDCYFDGFQYAVNSWARSEDLTVEYCEFSAGRFYERVRRIMDGRGGGDAWAALYFSPTEVNVVAQEGPGFVFRHNFLYEGFDGIQPRGIAPDLIGKLPDKASDISYNLFMNFVDNPLEPDGWTRLLNLRIHHNFVLDAFGLLSCAPTQRGPLTVDHNIFYNSPENGLNGGSLIKLGQPRSAFALNTGLKIVNNTFVQKGKNLVSPSPADFKDNLLEGNILVCNGGAWNPKGWEPSKHNLVSGTDAMPSAIHAEPGFISTRPMDFRLSERSPARGAGAKNTDLGAIPYGGNWDFPKPGPRWATPANMPQRPGWPASVSPKWGGLNAGT